MFLFRQTAALFTFIQAQYVITCDMNQPSTALENINFVVLACVLKLP